MGPTTQTCKMKAYLRNTFLVLVLTTGLAACGTTLQTQQVSTAEMATEVAAQKEFALKDKFYLANRTQNIGFDILTASAPLCGEKIRPALGMGFWTMESFSGDWRQAARNAFGIGQAVEVSRVAAKSPAAIGGLQKGDVLVKVGRHEVEAGKKGLSALQDYLQKNLTKNSLEVVYARTGVDGNDAVRTTTLTPVAACDYQVLYDDSTEVNAYADGRRIIMQRGILEFSRNDDEIAMIIGHELAHNVLNHVQKKTTQAAAGMLGGLLLDVLAGTGGEFTELGGRLGAQAYSPAYESEADYMGLYATARAGYNIERAPQLWRRMGARNTRAIDMTSTHPATAERFVSLEKTVREIQQKQQQGLPLVPDEKTR